MTRTATALLLAFTTLVALAVACGRYGPPRRPERPAEPATNAPLTDPAVPR